MLLVAPRGGVFLASHNVPEVDETEPIVDEARSQTAPGEVTDEGPFPGPIEGVPGGVDQRSA